jgi:Aspartyl/Asparaginyl beta-hydroxylase
MSEAAPNWAKGYPVAFLNVVSKIFSAEFKPHTYGAFGIPKERDVADAREAGQLMWTRAGGAEFAAAAIFRVVKTPTKHEDFAGSVATMRRGDLFVRSIAGTAEGKRRLLAEFKASGAVVWLEGHVENAELVELVESLGFHRVFTKVAASSDLKGMWCDASPGLAKNIRWPSGFNAADQVALKALDPGFLQAGERETILAELEAAPWAQHYSGYNKGKTWTAFAIAGYDPGDPGFIIKPSEMSKRWKLENEARLSAGCGRTSIAGRFPTAWAALERLGLSFQRVRFMRLAASGGELTRHADITDPEAGTKDGRIARLHIPLVSPEACVFRSWSLRGVEERLHMPEGALCYLDTRKPHAVINPGASERIHLVADAYATPALRALLAG